MQRQSLLPPAVAADQLRSWLPTSAGIRLRRATLLPDDSKDLSDGCLWRARLRPRGPAVHGTECELGLLAWAPGRSAIYLRRLQTPISWTAWFRFGHSVLDDVVAHLLPVSPQSGPAPTGSSVTTVKKEASFTSAAPGSSSEVRGFHFPDRHDSPSLRGTAVLASRSGMVARTRGPT
jgi:hypothetical protein